MTELDLDSPDARPSDCFVGTSKQGRKLKENTCPYQLGLLVHKTMDMKRKTCFR